MIDQKDLDLAAEAAARVGNTDEAWDALQPYQQRTQIERAARTVRAILPMVAKAFREQGASRQAAADAKLLRDQAQIARIAGNDPLADALYTVADAIEDQTLQNGATS